MATPPPGSDATGQFVPTKVLELELSHDLDPVMTRPLRADGTPYRRARVLARLHGSPLGNVEVDLTADTAPRRIAEAIRRQLAGAIAEHLAGDGLAPSTAWPLPGPPAACRGRTSAGPETPLATVVVCTIDRRERDLAGCLEALAQLRYPNYEVLVVDNSPHLPSTREIVARQAAGDDRFRILAERMPGLARARNTGLLYARGDLVAFTDDDVVADPGWLDAVVSEFTRDPQIACVTGPVMTAELETAEQAWFDEFGGFDKGFEHVVFDLGRHRDPSAIFPYGLGRFGTGANMSLRRNLLPDAWKFDVCLGAGSLTQGGEDQDAMLDVLRWGYRIAYRPEALVWHHHRSSYDALRRQMYHFGTGFGAVMTKRLLGDSGNRADLLRKLPAGARHVFAGGSRTAVRQRGSYAAGLRRAELRGLASAPVVYLRSRARVAWSQA